MNRTVRASSGTVVPPDVTRTTRRFASTWRSMKTRARASWLGSDLGGGFSLKYADSASAGSMSPIEGVILGVRVVEKVEKER